MKEKKPPPTTGIVLPWTSEKFIEAWELWKNYKKEIFGFVYKGVYSEQMTLKKLTELSNGEEDRAIRIIEQAISQQWQGLYPLHIPTFKENGKQTTKPNTKKGESSTLRERVQAEFNRRYGSGGQQADQPNTAGV